MSYAPIDLTIPKCLLRAEFVHFILIGNDFNWNNLSIKLQAGVDL